MKQALVAIEDARFYDHGGLDVQGTLRALVTNMAAGEVREGGSTLTQQLVKQTLLQAAVRAGSEEAWTAATDDTVGRKLREVRLALALEDTYGKDELLTRYLNIVYFGQNAYGIQPAARAFFGVDAVRAHAAPGRPAGRPGAEPGRRRPVHQPRGRHHPAQPGALPDGRPGLHHARRRRPRRRPPRSASPRPRRRVAAASRPASAPTSATSCRST